ncbi:response regulator [Roseateles cellulosilyticus]|uniref:Response regulator n=1 Tax=Pelomonas cellulosilytica TaxID=2906762 RepID=A0ABS8Y429_9BURK|nr:response regulator [Pelomonas sp. P8]MCE4557969.1 response regulator [Pelomonas sp. P8]
MNAKVVVVVDDDVDAADSLARALEMFGYTVFTAYGGNEALALILQIGPHSVVSDIDMPGMSGLEEATEVRASLNLCQPCMVAVTGAANEDMRARALHAGFDAFLAKPLSLPALLQLLEHGP